MVVDLVILSIAFSAGVATFFSPCSVALIPAYIGYFVGTEDDEAAMRDLRSAVLSGARFSGSAAAGILALFSLGGALLYVVQSQFAIRSTALSGTVTNLAIAVGVLIILLGGLMILGRAPSVSPKLEVPQRKSMLGMAGFGVVFAIGSMGCTLPVFITVITQAFTQGPLGAFLTFLVYGGGLAVMMVSIGIGLAVAKEQVHEHLRSLMPYVKPAIGLILVGAGVYMIYYYTAVIPG